MKQMFSMCVFFKATLSYSVNFVIKKERAKLVEEEYREGWMAII